MNKLFFILFMVFSVNIQAEQLTSSEKMERKVVSRMYQLTDGALARCPEQEVKVFEESLTAFIDTYPEFISLIKNSKYRQYSEEIFADDIQRGKQENTEKLSQECLYMKSILDSMLTTNAGRSSVEKMLAALKAPPASKAHKNTIGFIPLGEKNFTVKNKDISMSTEAIVIESPVKGQWAIFNPPGHPVLAYDFLAVDDNKSPYIKGGLFKHLVSFMDVSNTHAWEMPVFSPVNGTVIECGNDALDRRAICMSYDLIKLLTNKPKESEGFSAFGGNYVVIKTDDAFVLLCHLQKGSVKVKLGDELSIGQEIGRVGNSGSSVQPHLHVQVMESQHIFPLFGNLIPFRIKYAQKKSDHKYSEVADFTLENRGHYRF